MTPWDNTSFEIGHHRTGEALWKQQGIENASQAASSVLDHLAAQFAALSSALFAAEPSHTPSATAEVSSSSPPSSLVVSLISQTLKLRPPEAAAQLPHLLFVPLLSERQAHSTVLIAAFCCTILVSSGLSRRLCTSGVRCQVIIVPFSGFAGAGSPS